MTLIRASAAGVLAGEARAVNKALEHVHEQWP
jgi:hypothetical protein